VRSSPSPHCISTESQELKENHKTTCGFRALKWGSLQLPDSDLESSDFFELNIAIPTIWLAQTEEIMMQGLCDTHSRRLFRVGPITISRLKGKVPDQEYLLRPHTISQSTSLH
jgi:hypothetical protein